MTRKWYPALLLFFYTAVTNPVSAGDLLSGRELVDALRLGGYNIYFRHAATDWTQDDHIAAEGDWTSCDPARMRQLSIQGRSVARRIGVAIRRLVIPIGRVFSSEYCRTRETARYMGLGKVSSTRAVMNLRAAEYVGGRRAVILRARHLLSLPPQAGANDIFVAHGNLMQAALGVYTGEAGAVVCLPQGQGNLRVVARLGPEEWEALASAFTIAD